MPRRFGDFLILCVSFWIFPSYGYDFGGPIVRIFAFRVYVGILLRKQMIISLEVAGDWDLNTKDSTDPERNCSTGLNVKGMAAFLTSGLNQTILIPSPGQKKRESETTTPTLASHHPKCALNISCVLLFVLVWSHHFTCFRRSWL